MARDAFDKGVGLRETRAAELEALTGNERDVDVADYILPTTLERHRRQFARDDVVYLTVERDGCACGYCILVLETDGRSVEFRRSVVFERGAGIGQRAIGLMERYCRERLGRERVWLDVFDHNARGRHVYKSSAIGTSTGVPAASGRSISTTKY